MRGSAQSKQAFSGNKRQERVALQHQQTAKPYTYTSNQAKTKQTQATKDWLSTKQKKTILKSAVTTTIIESITKKKTHTHTHYATHPCA
eukprot:m.357996 g.357996  ORF g.357996 m.357996 type:complete len:89 (+) comp18011_c0_seq1:93-359(+)